MTRLWGLSAHVYLTAKDTDSAWSLSQSHWPVCDRTRNGTQLAWLILLVLLPPGSSVPLQQFLIPVHTHHKFGHHYKPGIVYLEKHILLFWCFLHKPFFLDFSRLPELFLLAEDTRMVKPQHTRGWVARALICTKVLRPEDSALYWSSCTPCQIASSLCTFVPALWLDQWDLARPPSPLRSHPGSSCPSLTWACHCSHPYLPWGLGPVYFHIPSIQHIVSLPLFVGWMKDTFIRSIPPLASHKACTFTCLQSTKVSPIKANMSTAKIYVS